MKRFVRSVLLVLFVFLALLILVNLFDAGKVENEYTQRDLRPASLGFENAYYQLWLIGEPPEVDTSSEAAMRPIRELFDPAADNSRAIREYTEKGESRRIASERYWKDLPVKFPDDSTPSGDGWFEFFRTNRASIVEQKQRCAIPLDRYAKLLEAPKVEDLSVPRYDAPIPGLLPLVRLAKLYTGIQMLRAVDGDWQGAFNALMEQINFCRRLIPGSRALITNLIGKSILNISLQAAGTLLNRPECPPEVATQLLAALPSLTYPEYGSKQGFICEYLAMADFIDGFSYETWKAGGEGPSLLYPLVRLGLQKNRTKQSFADYWATIIAYDSQEPFKWRKTSGVDFKDPTMERFWWFRNPVGKYTMTVAVPNFTSSIYRGYRLKARVDMTRIAAELHVKYTPGRSVREILGSLDSYRSTDPYSGKPYCYDEQSGILYSLGPDRTDNGGGAEAQDMRQGSDIIVPCALGRHPGEGHADAIPK